MALEGTEGSSQRGMGLEGQAEVFSSSVQQKTAVTKHPGRGGDRITSMLQTDSGRSVRMTEEMKGQK